MWIKSQRWYGKKENLVRDTDCVRRNYLARIGTYWAGWVEYYECHGNQKTWSQSISHEQINRGPGRNTSGLNQGEYAFRCWFAIIRARIG